MREEGRGVCRKACAANNGSRKSFVMEGSRPGTDSLLFIYSKLTTGNEGRALLTYQLPTQTAHGLTGKK